jgi:hypothetical protein
MSHSNLEGGTGLSFGMDDNDQRRKNDIVFNKDPNFQSFDQIRDFLKTYER